MSKSTFLEIFKVTGLRSDAILSVVDRNVAIFKTRHATTCYEFQVSQGKLWQNSLTFYFPKWRTIVLIFLNHFYDCKKPSKDTLDIWSLQGRWEIRPQFNDLLCKLALTVAEPFPYYETFGMLTETQDAVDRKTCGGIIVEPLLCRSLWR